MGRRIKSALLPGVPTCYRRKKAHTCTHTAVIGRSLCKKKVSSSAKTCFNSTALEIPDSDRMAEDVGISLAVEKIPFHASHRRK